MFENLCGSIDPKNEDYFIMASGFYIGNSHYVIVIQSMLGKVLDLNVTDLTEETF
tara:strand:+ start:10839 stop:11003 length:165 start_codon:yes stop_codon:yes gene_type:complete